MPAPTEISPLRSMETVPGPRQWVSDDYYCPIIGHSATTTPDGKYDARWLWERPRNLVVNGTFWRWSHGTSFGPEEYGPDLWYFSAPHADSAGLEQLAIAPGSFAGAPAFAARLTLQSVFEAPGVWSAGRVRLCQRLEDVRTAAGLPLAFGARLRAAASGEWTSAISYVRQVFGTGGSAAVETFGDLGGMAVDHLSFNGRLVDVIQVPSVTGKTIGANSYLEVGIEFQQTLFDQDTPTAVDVAEIQVRPGHVILPALPVDYAAEEAVFHRYWQRYEWASDYQQIHVARGFVYGTRGDFWFRRPMRVAPTVTFSAVSRFSYDVPFGFLSYGGTPTVAAERRTPLGFNWQINGTLPSQYMGHVVKTPGGSSAWFEADARFY